jgi:hypothetical protein
VELKFRAITMVLFVLTSTPTLAQDNAKPSAPLPTLGQDDPNSLPPSPDPVSSTSYTIPDTDVDLRLVAPPQSAPGTRMVLAPDIDDGAIGMTLQIPSEMLDIPLE